MNAWLHEFSMRLLECDWPGYLILAFAGLSTTFGLWAIISRRFWAATASTTTVVLIIGATFFAYYYRLHTGGRAIDEVVAMAPAAYYKKMMQSRPPGATPEQIARVRKDGIAHLRSAVKGEAESAFILAKIATLLPLILMVVGWARARRKNSSRTEQNRQRLA